jgi:vacuolar-type H+-ATPase subunit C/Vma6
MSAKVAVSLPYSIAKIRAMRGALFEGPRLLALERARNLPDLAQKLGLGPVAVDHLRLEALLTTRHIADLSRTASLLTGARGRLFDWLLLRYQMENLKVVLRFWAAGEPLERLSGHLVEVPGVARLPVEALAESRDLGSFIRQVPEPIFASGLREGLAYWEAEERTFLAEAGLDAAYFRELVLRRDNLSSGDRESVTPLVAADIDGYNLFLVGRAQLNYHLQLEDVTRFVVAGGLISGRLLLCAHVKSVSELVESLRLVRVLHLARTEVADLAELEDIMTVRLYRLANQRYYQSMLELGALVAFYYLKRNELANLIRAVEGLRYEVTWPEVLRRLVPSPGAETG